MILHSISRFTPTVTEKEMLEMEGFAGPNSQIMEKVKIRFTPLQKAVNVFMKLF